MNKASIHRASRDPRDPLAGDGFANLPSCESPTTLAGETLLQPLTSETVAGKPQGRSFRGGSRQPNNASYQGRSKYLASDEIL